MPSVIEVPCDLQLAGLDPAIDRRAQRIGGGDADIRVALFQRDGDAGQGAAGADRAGEAVDLAAGLLPDFRAGAFDMGLAVGDIVELVGPDRAVRFGLAPAARPAGPTGVT